MKPSILIVEDNQDMRTSIASFLTENGYNVRGVSSAEEGIDEVYENKFDLLLIDINLPGKSGFDFIEHVREEGHKMPLIAMTARDGIQDKIAGFELGLTDYIVKPFSLKEMHARIKAHLRDIGKTKEAEDVITTDNYELNRKNMSLKKNGKTIELTKLEFRIIESLIVNNHSLVTVDDLISDAWGEQEDLITPPIRIHIAKLRKKIGDDNFAVIKTVPGAGYIFNDPLELS
jgi:DNA-binding response OmpR family regulator